MSLIHGTSILDQATAGNVGAKHRLPTIEVLAESKVVWVSSFEGTENMAEKLTTALHRQAREWKFQTLRLAAHGAQLF